MHAACSVLTAVSAVAMVDVFKTALKMSSIYTQMNRSAWGVQRTKQYGILTIGTPDNITVASAPAHYHRCIKSVKQVLLPCYLIASSCSRPPSSAASTLLCLCRAGAYRLHKRDWMLKYNHQLIEMPQHARFWLAPKKQTW
jgi:hypothetical protein